MLEIPESHTLAVQLNATIRGKTISQILANTSPHGFAFYHGDPEDYPTLLSGKMVGDSMAFGGLLEINLGTIRLLFGDGVNIRYGLAHESKPQKHQLLLAFEDRSFLACTIQMYGGIWAFADGNNDNPYYLIAKEKISPLTEAFDAHYFEAMISQTKPTISMKAFLATEQRIPGLGNGALQDILFEARINPKRKLNTLSSQEVDRLFISVKQVLGKMVREGGRDTEKDLFGHRGGYQTLLSSKTYQKPCPVCGGSIVKQAYLGGSVYYCPVCQPL